MSAQPIWRYDVRAVPTHRVAMPMLRSHRLSTCKWARIGIDPEHPCPGNGTACDKVFLTPHHDDLARRGLHGLYVITPTAVGHMQNNKAQVVRARLLRTGLPGWEVH